MSKFQTLVLAWWSALVAAAPASAGSAPDTFEAEVWLVLPAERRPARDALRIAAELTQRFGSRLAVVVVWSDRDAPRRCGAEPDGGERWRFASPEWLDIALQDDRAVRAPVAVWRVDGEHVAWIEEFDRGARHVAEDLLTTGRVGRHWRGAVATILAPSSTRDVEDVLTQAMRQLADRPEYLAQVVLAAVGRDRHVAEWDLVVGAIEDAWRSCPESRPVAQAAFVVRHRRGDVRGALQAGFAWLEHAKGRRGVARELIDAVREAGSEYQELLELAYPIASQAAPDDVALLRSWLEDSLVARDDAAMATRVGERLVDTLVRRGDVHELNSFAWALLTRDVYAGRLDALALHAARRMVDLPEGRSYWRLDTLALACFRAGEFDEAIRVEEEALRDAEPAARDRYRERLESFRSARDARDELRGQ